MKKKIKSQRHYSGNKSYQFWRKIHGIRDKHLCSEAYTLGVVLQNVEGDILRLMDLLLNDPRAKPRVR